ncbi:hypothetical protein [Bradyrhizobium acaciae]|uniref:hypothetical protein n=1 Tax=Bradyrhizobium acaciae TaxID=2683706 RepID=UPI001E43AA4D|nr:hypothetical protein [Bradyrhizobium acaciae]MCC8982621.1 hypothetical protein [Bradyrhizobium acaciae]
MALTTRLCLEKSQISQSKRFTRWSKDQDRELLQLRNSGMHTRLLAGALGRTETAIKARLAVLAKHPPPVEPAPQAGNISITAIDCWIADQGFTAAASRPFAATRRERLRAIGRKNKQHGLEPQATIETAVPADAQFVSAVRTRRPIEIARNWLFERQSYLQHSNQFTRDMVARTEERLRVSRAILAHPLAPIVKRAVTRIEPDGQR